MDRNTQGHLDTFLFLPLKCKNLLYYFTNPTVYTSISLDLYKISINF